MQEEYSWGGTTTGFTGAYQGGCFTYLFYILRSYINEDARHGGIQARERGGFLRNWRNTGKVRICSRLVFMKDVNERLFDPQLLEDDPSQFV